MKIMKKRKIVTCRLGDKLIVLNGVDPLAYVDLTRVNKGPKAKAIVRYTEVKPFSLFYEVKSND